MNKLTRFVVTDANRQALAYVYYENEPGRRSAAKLLTKDEIAANVAKLGRSVAHMVERENVLRYMLVPRPACLFNKLRRDPPRKHHEPRA